MTSGSKRSKPNMIWTKRILLALPFAAAAALTVLINVADRLHLRREHIAGYGFLFATPWAWLLDRGWFGDVRSRWAQEFIAYAVILWIAALVLSGCLSLFLRGFGFWSRRDSRRCSYLTSRFDQQSDSEFKLLLYKRGCQEHFSPSARCRGFDLRHPAPLTTKEV